MVVDCLPLLQKSSIERTRRSTRSITRLHQKGQRKTKRESTVTGHIQVMKTPTEEGQDRDHHLKSTSAGRSEGIGHDQGAMIVKIEAIDIIAQDETRQKGQTTTVDQLFYRTMRQVKSSSLIKLQIKVPRQNRKILALICRCMGTD